MINPDEITVEIHEVDGRIMLVEIRGPSFRIELIGEVFLSGRRLHVKKAHVQGASPALSGVPASMQSGGSCCWKLMSMNFSLREALGRQAERKTESPDRSASRIGFELSMTVSGIDRPVDVARALTDQGLSLSGAHRILEQLASGERVDVAVDHRRVASFRNRLRDLGVLLRDPQPTGEVSSEFVENL